MADGTKSNDNQWEDVGETENDSINNDSPLPPNCPLPPSDSESSPVCETDNNPYLNILMTPMDDGLLKATAATIVRPKPQSNPSTPQTRKSPHTKAKKLRKRTQLFNSPTVLEYKLRVAKLEREVTFFKDYIEEVKDDCQVEILNACERTKNGLSTKFKEKIDEHDSYIESLHNRINALENSEKSLTKQVIPSLKGRITALEKENNKLSEKVCKLEIQNREYSNLLENSAQNLNDSTPDNSDQGVRNHTCPDIADSPRSSSGHSDHEPPAEITRHVGSDSSRPEMTPSAPNLVGNAPVDSRQRVNFHVQSQLTGSSHNNDVTAQTGNLIPEVTSPISGDSPTRMHDRNRHDTDSKHERQRPLNFDINVNTTHVLIGDSTIKGINPQKSTPRHTQWTKTCIGGLQTTELPDLLPGTINYPEVKEVYLHTGVSDSKRGPLSTKACSDSLKHLMYKFPSAKINVSSIIPTKGRDSLSESVKESNTNMKSACNKLNIKFVDNETVFLSRNGAPKIALYNDKIHPSRKGTAVLANNIFGSPNHETKHNWQNYEAHQNNPNLSSTQSINQPPINHNDFPPLSSSSSQIRNHPHDVPVPRHDSHLDRQQEQTGPRPIPHINHYGPRLYNLGPRNESLAYHHTYFREPMPPTNQVQHLDHYPNFQFQTYLNHSLPLPPLSIPYPFYQQPQQHLNHQAMPHY